MIKLSVHTVTKKMDKLLDSLIVPTGEKYRSPERLRSRPNIGHFMSKEDAEEAITAGIQHLSLQQDKLYAQDSYALLIIFQAMDAAGKDSTIKHVMSGVNPQGVQVTSFKVPSVEELDHDYLWRNCIALPRKGRYRHLQPVVLRGSPRGKGASGIPRPPAPAPATQ